MIHSFIIVDCRQAVVEANLCAASEAALSATVDYLNDQDELDVFYLIPAESPAAAASPEEPGIGQRFRLFGRGHTGQLLPECFDESVERTEYRPSGERLYAVSARGAVQPAASGCAADSDCAEPVWELETAVNADGRCLTDQIRQYVTVCGLDGSGLLEPLVQTLLDGGHYVDLLAEGIAFKAADDRAERMETLIELGATVL